MRTKWFFLNNAHQKRVVLNYSHLMLLTKQSALKESRLGWYFDLADFQIWWNLGLFLVARVLDASDWVVNIWTLFWGWLEKKASELGSTQSPAQSAIIIVPLFFYSLWKKYRVLDSSRTLSSLRPKLSRLPMLPQDPFHLFRQGKSQSRALH